MYTVTAKINDNVNKLLSDLALEVNRSKGYIMQRAIETYLEEKSDILIALSRIERGEATISLDDIEEKYDLDN